MKTVKLGEIADVIISGVDKKTKDGESYVKLCNFVDVYYNWAVGKDMYDSFMHASAKNAEIEKFTLQKGQVAITKDSETRFDIGIPTYIADDFEDVLLGYHCALITPHKGDLCGKYLNALLNTEYAKKYFANNATGSGQRYTISEDIIRSFPVPIVDISEQERIGNIFSHIDRKIALNKRTNTLLEAMAKQLYDYWFVQFDFPDENGRPYKSSGGKMVWNEKLKREIPEGWEIVNLPSIASFTNGLACQKFRPTNDKRKLPVIKIAEMHNGLSESTEFVKEDISDAVKVYNGDILFSWSASLEVIIWSGGNGGLNQHIFKVLPINEFTKYYVYFQLRGYIDVFKSIADSRKTTMGHITSDHLNQSKICVPDANHLNIVTQFEMKVNCMLDLCMVNMSQKSQLMSLRNQLLPLLMSGQVTIKD